MIRQLGWFLGCGLFILLGLFGIEQIARAHAEYERSEPAANAVIPIAPTEVQIWFTQELFRRQGANLIEVSGPDGAKVDRGDTRIDDDDRKHVLVSLQTGLAEGRYSVRWRNLSADDGDEHSGEFSFTVAAGAGEATPQPNPTVAQPAEVTRPVAATSTSVAAPPPTSGLPCLGGLLVGGAFLAMMAMVQRGRGSV
jgi:methionine-rich copper-binding protein CopC